MTDRLKDCAPIMLATLKHAAAMLRQPVFGPSGTSNASAAQIMRSDACALVLIIENAIASAEKDA